MADRRLPTRFMPPSMPLALFLYYEAAFEKGLDFSRTSCEFSYHDSPPQRKTAEKLTTSLLSLVFNLPLYLLIQDPDCRTAQHSLLPNHHAIAAAGNGVEVSDDRKTGVAEYVRLAGNSAIG